MKKSKLLTIARTFLVIVACLGAWRITEYLGQGEMVALSMLIAAGHLILFQHLNSTTGVGLLTERRKTLFGVPLALLGLYIFDGLLILTLLYGPYERLLPPLSARAVGYSLFFSVCVILIDWWCICMPARFRLSEDERREISRRRADEARESIRRADEEAAGR